MRLPSCTKPAAPGRTGWEATVPICCRPQSHTGHILPAATSSRGLWLAFIALATAPVPTVPVSSAPRAALPQPEASPGAVSGCTHARTSLARLPASIDPRGSTQGKHTHTTHTRTHKQGSLCKQLLVKLKLNSAQILTFGGDTNSADIFTSFINGPDHSALDAELEEMRAAEVPRLCVPPHRGALPGAAPSPSALCRVAEPSLRR